jgi:hypothetical protein
MKQSNSDPFSQINCEKYSLPNLLTDYNLTSQTIEDVSRCFQQNLLTISF